MKGKIHGHVDSAEDRVRENKRYEELLKRNKHKVSNKTRYISKGR